MSFEIKNTVKTNSLNLAEVVSECMKHEHTEIFFKEFVHSLSQHLQAESVAVFFINGHNLILKNRNNPNLSCDLKIDLNAGVISKACKDGSSLLVEEIMLYPDLKSQLCDFEKITQNMVIAPIKIRNEVVGALHIMNSHLIPHFTKINLLEIEMAAHYLAMEFENQKIYGALQNKFFMGSPDLIKYEAKQALRHHEQNTKEQILPRMITDSVKNPENVARLLSRSFYKQLRKQGFDAKNIMQAADEILKCLNLFLDNTNQKTEI